MTVTATTPTTTTTSPAMRSTPAGGAHPFVPPDHPTGAARSFPPSRSPPLQDRKEHAVGVVAVRPANCRNRPSGPVAVSGTSGSNGGAGTRPTSEWRTRAASMMAEVSATCGEHVT